MYPRGSEWRKWDLHIHTPKSIVQHYGGDTPEAWDKFIQKLASLPKEVAAIAVTDYLFCDGYELLVARRNEIQNIALMIPNIEFRLNTFSGTAENHKRHNFHVLFDPTVSPQIIREQLLNSLSTGYRIDDKTEWQQTPTRASLEELGRQIKAAAPAGNAVHGKTDLMVGFDNITYKKEDIEKQLEKTPFRGRYVTAVGYSEWNASRWDQSAAEKRSLINTANFALTSLDNPASIEDNKKNLIENKLNSIVLHSSDAHDLDRIGKSLLWIKADPTFAGLKQVLNEPDARVFIGQSPPNLKPDHKVIARVSISQSAGWFADNFSLELNRDLVAVIGGRGSGKSALAEAIAFGAGSRDRLEDAFLKKATKHDHPITGTTIRLEWGGGTVTEFRVGDDFEEHDLVRYLPQGAVEELCSHRNSEALQQQIENVIFQALDKTQRMNASNFSELKSRVLNEFKYEKDQAVRKIRFANKRLAAVIQGINAEPTKKKLLGERKAELERLNTTLPELPPEDKRGQEELSALVEIRKIFESKIVEITDEASRVTDAETVVKVFRSRIEEYQAELTRILEPLGVADLSIFQVRVDEVAIKAFFEVRRKATDRSLKSMREGTRSDVSQLVGIPEDTLPFDNLSSLNKGIEEKQKATRAFETTKLKYQQQKASASAVEENIRALETEIAKIAAELIPERERMQAERLAAYLSYFEILGREKVKMEELYKPIQDSLRTGTDTDKKLSFEARINYRLDPHCQAGLAIIDRSRRGNFRDPSRLKDSLNMLAEEYARASYGGAAVRTELEEFLSSFENFEGAPMPIERQLRENCGLEEFFNWLFDPSHFEIVSSLKFDGADLYVLSPGQKGIILLMLYLEIDKADDRPLIIDQPEENLDNLSIYDDLMDYFRGRKQYRQIVMVTHNPNLVVNTDAEQIVLAHYDGMGTPRLSYASGSLEDQAKHIPDVPVESLENGIIEQVCGILEGGELAFNKRKRKYQISRKSRI